MLKKQKQKQNKKKQKKPAVKKHIFNVRIFRYLGPVIYTNSNQNLGFMQSVGLRLSLYEVRNNLKKKKKKKRSLHC